MFYTLQIRGRDCQGGLKASPSYMLPTRDKLLIRRQGEFERKWWEKINHANVKNKSLE